MKNVNLFLYNALYFRVADADARKSLSDGLTLKLAECEPSEKKAVLRECKENIKASFKLDGFKIYLTVLNALTVLAAVIVPISIAIYTSDVELNSFLNILYTVSWYSIYALVPLFIISYLALLLIKRVKIKYTLYNLAAFVFSVVLAIASLIIVLCIVAIALSEF